jgi:hypothetical protein
MQAQQKRERQNCMHNCHILLISEKLTIQNHVKRSSFLNLSILKNLQNVAAKSSTKISIHLMFHSPYYHQIKEINLSNTLENIPQVQNGLITYGKIT